MKSSRESRRKQRRVFVPWPAFMICGAVLIFQCMFLDAEEKTGETFLDFAEAGRLAISASEELRNEYRRHYLKQGAWTWALRSYFPQFSFSVSEDDRLSTIGNDSFVKNYSVGAEQLLWDGGRISLSRKLEKAELALESGALGRTASDIAESAISLYRQVLYYRKLKEIRENTLVSLEEQRSILTRELELGLAMPVDLAGADLTVAGAQIELESLKLDLGEAETRLAEILGLEGLPSLVEGIDVEKNSPILDLGTVRGLAETRNPELQAARLAVIRREAETKAASLSWLPVLKLTGTFALSGLDYPLNRYNWSIGFIMEFSSPWISGKVNGSAGWEPPYERNARLQSGVSPLPNPAEAYSARNAKLALELEKSNYSLAFKRAGRLAEQAVEKCGLLEKKRSIALRAVNLEGERYRLAELKLELGRLTRVELMEARLEYAAKEAALIEAAAALLEAERELERIMNLNPGDLSAAAVPENAVY